MHDPGYRPPSRAVRVLLGGLGLSALSWTLPLPEGVRIAGGLAAIGLFAAAAWLAARAR